MNDQNKMNKYQIYCDRGNGLELDGCWGSEHAKFENLDDAIEGAKHLAKNYPDCDWVVADLDGRNESHRIAATETNKN